MEANKKLTNKPGISTQTTMALPIDTDSDDEMFSTNQQSPNNAYHQTDDREGHSSGTKILTRMEAFKLFKGKAKQLPLSERVSMVVNYFGSEYQLTQTNEELKQTLSGFLSKSQDYLKRCKFNESYFIRKKRDWLSGTLVSGHLISVPVNDETSPATFSNNETIFSPKSKRFMALSRSQQYRSKRKLSEALENEPNVQKIQAFVRSIKIGGQNLPHSSAKDLETLLCLCLESETAPTEILKKVQTSSEPYTPIEALAMITDRNMSVETYSAIRLDLKRRGFDAYPPYYKIQEAKKTCYPDQVEVSEREASVPLQSLLYHTVTQVFKLCDEVIINYCTKKSIQAVDFILRGNWGFDGSTGQSLYKQSFSDAEGDENSLFATTFTPLQVVTKDDNDVIWVNPAPSSFRYCRPLHLQYKKETKELITLEKHSIQDQIEKLSPIITETSRGHTIKVVEYDLYCAAIDGKVLNTILCTPSQLRCPYCDLTSSQFNDLDLAFSKPVIEERLVHGISPLHSWIRVLEFLLNLGYKVEVKKWRIPQRSEESRLVEDRKKIIQSKIREEMGLLVDVVRPTSGTTNDGNTARTALSDRNRGTFANILNIDQWLLDELFVILTVLSSNLPIDPEKFAIFCKELAYKYVAKYGWHPMTVTLHKILVHGSKIIEKSNLPIGMLSEQAAESRNKFWRFDREHHTRKKSRETTMSDLFHRALVSSDPIISDYNLLERKKKAKKIPLPPAALTLLRPINEENLAIDDYSHVELIVTNNEDEF